MSESRRGIEYSYGSCLKNILFKGRDVRGVRRQSKTQVGDGGSNSRRGWMDKGEVVGC